MVDTPVVRSTEIDTMLGYEYQDAAAVDVSSADDTTLYRAVYIGTGGAGTAVKVTTVRGSAVVFSNVPSGTVLPVAVKRIWHTGTSATNIVGLV